MEFVRVTQEWMAARGIAPLSTMRKSKDESKIILHEDYFNLVARRGGEGEMQLDGEYVISKPAGLRGFKLYNDAETGYRAVTFEIVNEPYDAGNHLVDAAALHVPESWREKLTTDMLASAAKKVGRYGLVNRT